MRNRRKDIVKQFQSGASIKVARNKLKKFYPKISMDEISSVFNELAQKELESADLNKISFEVINDDNFCRYQCGSRDFYVNTTNNNKVYFDRDEIISSKIQSSGIIETGKINVLDIIKSDSFRNTPVLPDIEMYLRKYIGLKNDESYTVLAAYALLTYVFGSFPAIPYLRLKGNKGTGKSTILSVLKNIVHGPYLVSNLTTAALIRITDDPDTTLLLDEAENLGKRGSSSEMLFEILNSGYKRDGRVTRVSNGKLREYSTYGPKIIACINELVDTTEDRTIIIETDPESTGKDIIPFLDTPEQRRESEALKIKILSQVPALQRDIQSELSISTNFPDIKNRNRERWLPLLLITKILSWEMDRIMRAAERDISQKVEKEKSTPESIAMATLTGYIRENEENSISRSTEYICFEASPICDQIKVADVYRKFNNQGQITKFLKSSDVLVDRIRVKGIPTIIYKIPITLFNHKENGQQWK